VKIIDGIPRQFGVMAESARMVIWLMEGSRF
jgi:hypothetical protein